MIDALWWLGIAGGLAGTVISLFCKGPFDQFVEEAEQLIAQFERDNRDA